MRSIIKKLNDVILQHNQTDTMVVSKDQTYSYGEVLDMMNFMTSILINKCNVGYQQYIGVYMDRKADYIPVIFSIINANGVFVPLDIHSPKDRMKLIVNECNLSCIITDLNYAEMLGEMYEYNYCWNNICFLYNVITEKTHDNINDELPELLYCIYTSGSTGRPKGVMLYEEGLLNLVEQTQKEIYLQFKERVNVGLIAQFNFDLSLLQIMPAIILGHVLYISSDEQRKDGRAIVDFINSCNIRIIDLTPSHIDLVCMSLKKFDTIRHKVTLISSGEELKLNTVKNITELLGDSLELINYYGPTECTVEATINHIDSAQLEGMSDVPIGRPIGGTRCYVLNEELEVVKPFEKGELYLAGICVAKGYVKRAKETMERFLPDIHHSNEKMYKTGDIGFYDENGVIHYLGRNDNQVKINGYRIELGEIENAINEMNKISRSCIIKYEYNGGKRIIAFICEKEAVTEEEVKDYLINKVPTYMIPATIIKIDDFPLTSNGKIDKAALQVYYQRIIGEYKGSEKVRKPTKGKNEDITSMVTSIFKDILKISDNIEIKEESSFLSLGGDSISIFLFICQIYDVFSVEIEFNEFYANNKITDIVNMIQCANVVSKDEEKSKCYTRAPTTNMESFFMTDNPSNKMLIYLECKLFKKVDGARLEEAFEKVMANQCIFNSVYLKKGSTYTKILDPSGKKRYQIVYCSDSEINNNLLHNSCLLHNEEFNITIHIGETALGVVFDHKIMDIYSGKLLINQAFEYYLSVRESNLNNLYYKYSYEERKYLNSIEYDYALKELVNNYMQEPEYDFDYILKNLNKEVEIADYFINEDDMQKISKYSKEKDCTKFVLFLSAFMHILSSKVEYNKFPIGIFNEGRFKNEHKDIIGNFAYPFPIVINRSNFEGYMEPVKKIMSDRYSFKYLQIADVLQYLPENLRVLWKEIFVYMVNYYNFRYEGDLYGFIDYMTLSENSDLVYPMKLDIEENSRYFHLNLSINLEVFPALCAQNILKELTEFLIDEASK